jgi:hypothetical protein
MVEVELQPAREVFTKERRKGFVNRTRRKVLHLKVLSLFVEFVSFFGGLEET